MTRIFYISVTALLLLSSCKTSKNFLDRVNDDGTLYDVVKQLNKDANDSNAIKALSVVYASATQRHLGKINIARASKDISRWDKIAVSYAELQKMYDVIHNSPTANTLLTPVNYQQEIYDVKEAAAEEYYVQASNLLENGTREDLKRAHSYFKKSDKWVPGYKDTKALAEDAYNSAIINVVINPVTDNSFFFNIGWGNVGYNYSNEYFQQNLVRDLGGQYATRYPARFYTDWEARRDNVQPNWVVDLIVRNLYIPNPSTYNYSRTSSKRIETGKDTSGKVIYQPVYATVNITRRSFTARGEIEVRITDIDTRKNITSNSYQNDYTWQEEYASYTGDSRALSASDQGLMSHRSYNDPRKEDILREIYRNIYPQVRNKISYAVDW